jgi:tetratricopeptide (TPR) repeat protein
MSRLPLLLGALILAPLPALAVLDDEQDAPPAPTPTSMTCADGKVWDEATKGCIDVKAGLVDDDALYRAARELAHAGRYEAAIAVASAMTDPEDDRALTVLGFAHRKAGRVDLGMALYDRAIARNPGNLLVRSYKGMAHVEAGEIALARAELAEIEARGGAGGWPAQALRTALDEGKGFSY